MYRKGFRICHLVPEIACVCRIAAREGADVYAHSVPVKTTNIRIHIGSGQWDGIDQDGWELVEC